MEENKMKRVITAVACALTALLVFLLCVMVYQWIKIGVADNRLDKVKAEYETQLERNQQAENDAIFYESEIGKALAWWEMQQLQGK